MQQNLRTEAERAGVDPPLIFARGPLRTRTSRVSGATSRSTLAYGAHTPSATVVAGVSQATCRGATFAGRVGASLLTAAGLPELITDSPEAYGARLLELVSAPQRVREYGDQLNRTREANPLFDTAGFTRDWEALLLEIYDSAVRSPG